MAVRLRLTRLGSKKAPFYRIVASDSKSPRDGKFIEILGTYNPSLKENKVVLKEDLIKKWLDCGAQPTDTVKSLISNYGILKKYYENKNKR